MNGKTIVFRTLVLLSLATLPVPGQADIIRLSDGREVQGSVVSRDEETISIEMSGSVIKLPVSRVESIKSTGEAQQPTNATLAKGEQFLKAGEMKRAWEAFADVIADKLAADDTREKATRGQQQAIAETIAPTMKRLMALIAKNKYDESLREAKNLGNFSRPGSFEEASGKRCLAETRVAVAQDMCSRNFPAMALRFLKPLEKEVVGTTGFNAVMGDILLRLDRDEEAPEYLKGALQEDPGNHALRNRLFLVLARVNDNEGIAKVWNSRPKDFSIVEHLSFEGRTALSQGLRSHALKLLANGSGPQAIPFYDQGAGIVPTRNSAFYAEAALFYEGVGDLAKSEQMSALQASALRQEKAFAEKQALLTELREKMKEKEKENMAERREEEVKNRAGNLEKERKKADQELKEDMQRDKKREQDKYQRQRDAARASSGRR